MINIADILKYCPKGTKLYSPICGNCKLLKIYNGLGFDVINDTDEVFNFSYDGRYNLNGECCIFPSKDNRDWNTFRPFKDGDILTYTSNHTTTFIYRNKDNEPHLSTSFYVACNDAKSHNFLIYNKYTLIALNENCDVRLSTEDEKIKLFDAIKANGYKWNAETKTLEKLIAPKFKVGDEIVKRNSVRNSCIVVSINSKYYEIKLSNGIGGIAVLPISEQDDWKLVHMAPKFKVGDRIKLNNSRFIYTITDLLKDRYRATTNSCDLYEIEFERQDAYKLVPNHKFKVGDKVKHIHTGIYCHIKAYADELKGHYTSIGHFIKDDNVDEWEIIPNKFDISTLKAYDKVLVRDDNNSAWINTFFGFYDTVTNKKYPFIAGSVNWVQCIPYEGNEHLLGTNNNCDEYYKNW